MTSTYFHISLLANVSCICQSAITLLFLLPNLWSWWRHQMEHFPRFWPGYWWVPRTKASDTELWYYLWPALEQTVEHTMETPVIWDAIVTVMMYDHGRCSLNYKIPFYHTSREASRLVVTSWHGNNFISKMTFPNGNVYISCWINSRLFNNLRRHGVNVTSPNVSYLTRDLVGMLFCPFWCF